MSIPHRFTPRPDLNGLFPECIKELRSLFGINLFNYKDPISRRVYWTSTLIMVGISIVINLLTAVIAGVTGAVEMAIVSTVISGLIGVVMGLFGLNLGVRRSRETVVWKHLYLTLTLITLLASPVSGLLLRNSDPLSVLSGNTIVLIIGGALIIAVTQFVILVLPPKDEFLDDSYFEPQQP